MKENLLLSSLLVNNLILWHCLGLCPFFGLSGKVRKIFGLAIALLFVLILSTPLHWLIYHFFLFPFRLSFLRAPLYFSIIYFSTQLGNFLLSKVPFSYAQEIKAYLPMARVNCAVLGVALLSVDQGYHFLNSLLFAIGSGLGLLLVGILLAGMRERIELSPLPKSFKGYPIIFILTGLLSLIFMAFSGHPSLDLLP